MTAIPTITIKRDQPDRYTAYLNDTPIVTGSLGRGLGVAKFADHQTGAVETYHLTRVSDMKRELEAYAAQRHTGHR